MSFYMPQIDEITVKKEEPQQVVKISMKEYKELLITKGRYEELSAKEK